MLSITSSAPTLCARSRMSSRPKCPSGGPAAVAKPGPSSDTTSRSRRSAARASSTACAAPAWRSTFVSASDSTRSATTATSGEISGSRSSPRSSAALLGADERIEVVGLARDGREALALAERRRPDVVLLDLNMPEVDGLEACARLRKQHGPEVLMLTVSEEEPDLYAALRVGAAGYLTKDVPPAELIEAVLAVARGEPRIAPAMASRMLADMGRGESPPEDHWRG